MQYRWIALTLLCCSPLAVAHEGGHQPFEKVDSDGDGMITRTEAEANAPGLATRFDAIDADKDGSLSRDELRAHAKQRDQHRRHRAEEAFGKADANGDGQLSQEEANQGMPFVGRQFSSIDVNDDGAVSREEFRAHVYEHHKHRDGAKREPREQL